MEEWKLLCISFLDEASLSKSPVILGESRSGGIDGIQSQQAILSDVGDIALSSTTRTPLPSTPLLPLYPTSHPSTTLILFLGIKSPLRTIYLESRWSIVC